MNASNPRWPRGTAPVAVVMLSLNEGHNIARALENLAGWAQEVFLVDSYSQDETLDIALRYGAYVVQRRFRGFGDQWNFALEHLPVTAPWTMKLDPDERLTDPLKKSIADLACTGEADGVLVTRRLHFIGRPLPVRQTLLRVWRTGRCRFSDVAVNEHPFVRGKLVLAKGDLEHHDSPDLEHWLEKQNRYTTAEAIMSYEGAALADVPRVFGTPFQRRMWLKRHFDRLPSRYVGIFLYNWLWLGAWRAGKVGVVWARLRCDVMRLREYKALEMRLTGRVPGVRCYGPGMPDARVPQCDGDAASRASTASYPKGAAINGTDLRTVPEVVPLRKMKRLRYFDSLAGEWADKYRTSRFFKERESLILSIVDKWDLTKDKALDYGCGAGVFTRELAGRFHAVVGVDSSPAMRQAAQAALAGVLNVTVVAPEELEGGGFDFILCSSVIEYVDEDGDFLRRLAGALGPSGRLLITFPRRWGPLQMLNRWLLKHFQADSYARHQVHTYTESTIRRMAVNAGLRCEALVPGVRLWPFLPMGVGEQVNVVMGKAR